MNPNTKMFLMFAPLLAFFPALAFLVTDMRNPTVDHDDCVVMATGVDVQDRHIQGRSIYRQSENALNDVALKCNRYGTMVLNDAHLFQTQVETGQGAHVAHKQYRILPDRWSVDVFTGTPNEQPRLPF